MRLANRQFETFNDGLMDVCAASGRVIKKTKISGIRFGNKTAGAKRFWDAQALGNTISRMVCILYVPGIERDDIAIIQDRQYRILQVQAKFDTRPPCLYLSLENTPVSYRDERGTNG